MHKTFAHNLWSRLQGISAKRGVVFFITSIIAGTSTAIAITGSSKIAKKSSYHSLPINEQTIYWEPLQKDLWPMPIGEIELAAKKVKNNRNPFKEPSGLESENIDIINSAIKFSGIAKVDNILVAMIETKEGQKAYRVGDPLGNGFFIKSISKDNVTVDISNGSKDYRLYLKALSN